MKILRKIYNTPNFIINSLRTYKQAKKKLKKPFLFFINLYWYKLFKKNLIKNITTLDLINFKIEDLADFSHSIEYVNNYYNIDDLKNKKLNVVVDIGANSGDFSIFLNKSAKKIFAFEPITEVYDKMNKNILVNNLDNIKTFNLGVSEKCQKLKLTIPESTGSSKVSIFGDYEIKTISWDKLYELIEKPQKIDLLKMDCEGCEYSLINNSSILDYVQEIRMEIHIFEEKDKYKAINLLKLLCMKKFLLIKTTEFNINKQGNWEMHFMKI